MTEVPWCIRYENVHRNLEISMMKGKSKKMLKKIPAKTTISQETVRSPTAENITQNKASKKRPIISIGKGKFSFLVFKF